MQHQGLQIAELTTVGFKPVILFEGWRVATLCYVDDLYPPEIAYLERHLETDEVFILLHGQATLMMGGVGQEVSAVEAVPLELLKTFNVKLGAWHGVIMSRDAVILLVENVDTGKPNTEFFNLTPALQQTYLEVARGFPDWQGL